MTREELSQQIKQVRLDNQVDFVDMATRINMPYLKLKKMEDGSANFKVSSVFGYLNTLQKSVVFYIKETKIVVHSFQDLSTLWKAIFSSEAQIDDLASRISYSKSYLHNLIDADSDMNIDLFLDICRDAGISFSIISARVAGTIRAENKIHLRKEFCKQILYCRKRSGRLMKDICFDMQTLPSKIYRLEKGAYNFDVRTLFNYLKIINYALGLTRDCKTCMCPEYSDLWQYVIQLRSTSNLSQRAYASFVGVTHAMISNIELQKNPITIDTLLKICNTWGVQIQLYINKTNE